jgi:hypothetical protein
MLPSIVCLRSLRNTARNCSHSNGLANLRFQEEAASCVLVRQEVIAVILLQEMLRSQWRHGMSFEAAGKLRDDLDAVLRQTRSERHIRTPVFECPRWVSWRRRGTSVNVRAALSLLRFGTTEAESNKSLKEIGSASLAASLFGHHQRHRESPNAGGRNSDSQSLPLA